MSARRGAQFVPIGTKKYAPLPPIFALPWVHSGRGEVKHAFFLTDGWTVTDGAESQQCNFTLLLTQLK